VAGGERKSRWLRGRQRVRGKVWGEGRHCGGRAAAENGKEGEKETEKGDRHEHGRADMGYRKT
jgi:hypothetical protein